MNFTFPQYTLKTEERDHQTFVWDDIRKKWLLLTAEEYVRQQLVLYMIHEKGISPTLIGIEKEIRYHKLRKRLDVLVFDTNGQPLILCECKAPKVSLSQDTLQQVSRYNVSLQAKHLLITNGISLLFFSRNKAGKYCIQKSGWY